MLLDYTFVTGQKFLKLCFFKYYNMFVMYTFTYYIYSWNFREVRIQNRPYLKNWRKKTLELKNQFQNICAYLKVIFIYRSNLSSLRRLIFQTLILNLQITFSHFSRTTFKRKCLHLFFADFCNFFEHPHPSFFVCSFADAVQIIVSIFDASNKACLFYIYHQYIM